MPKKHKPRRERSVEVNPEPKPVTKEKPVHKDFPPKRRPTPAPRAPQAKAQTHWGDVAEWYDALVGDDGSEYHRKIIIPGLLRMLELHKLEVTTPQVVDLACGQGVICRRLAEEGCKLTGVDAAAPLIKSARRRNAGDQLAIEYMLADVTELLDESDKLKAPLRPAAYDAVTIVLSIQNISPLTPVWRAAHALLKPGGRLIIVMMHPCFRIPKQSDWFWDEGSHSQARIIRQYLGSTDIDILTHPGDAAHGIDDSSTTHFHRPLQAYINTLGNAGLYIDHIEEWTSHKTDQAGPKKEAIDRARKEIPLFLALRARRV